MFSRAAGMLARWFLLSLSHSGISGRPSRWPLPRRWLPVLPLSGAALVRVFAQCGQPFLAPLGCPRVLRHPLRTVPSLLFHVLPVVLRRPFRLLRNRISLCFGHEIRVLATRVTLSREAVRESRSAATGMEVLFSALATASKLSAAAL